MRLWHSLALVVVTIALVLSLCKVREVSAQRNDGTGTVVASQTPSPGEPAAQVPGQPVPGQPPVPGGPMIPKPPIAAPLPPVAIAANSEFVYVVWGNLLLQFDARNLKLVRRLPLKGEFPAELKGEAEKPKRKKEQPNAKSFESPQRKKGEQKSEQ